MSRTVRDKKQRIGKVIRESNITLIYLIKATKILHFNLSFISLKRCNFIAHYCLYREKDRGRNIFHPLAHCPNQLSSQS